MSPDASAEAAILRAVQGLDDKLSKALREQTGTLTRTIQQLVDRHNESMLQQAERNAMFANRDRVEAVAEHGHEVASLVQTLAIRVATNEAEITSLKARDGIRSGNRLLLLIGIAESTATIAAVIIARFFT